MVVGDRHTFTPPSRFLWFDDRSDPATTVGMRVPRILVASTWLVVAAGCGVQNADNNLSSSAGGISSNGGTVGNTPATPPPEPTVTPTAYVTVPINSTEPELLAWLRWQKVHVEIDSDGDARVYDGASTRRAMVQYRRMLALKKETIALNIANRNTTRDARGNPNPYRRKHVEIDAKGNVEVKEATGPFREVYDPSHPDADVRGIVKYPDVDLTVEEADSQSVESEHQLVMVILQRFDPTIVSAQSEPARATTPAAAQPPENPFPVSSR